MGRHLYKGGAVSELRAPSHEGENGFAVYKEELPPVTCRELEIYSQSAESLRTFLGFDDKLVPIGTADTVREDFVQVEPLAV